MGDRSTTCEHGTEPARRVSDAQVGRDLAHAYLCQMTAEDRFLMSAGYPSDLRDARAAIATERERAETAERERDEAREHFRVFEAAMKEACERGNADLAARRALEAERDAIREACATDLKEAVKGFDMIHTSLMGAGPKQASGEITAHWLLWAKDRAAALVHPMAETDGDDGSVDPRGLAKISEADPCGCIVKVNAALLEAGRNTKVEQLLRLHPTIGESLALVRTIAANKKRGARPTTVEATFCPFCGVKYPLPAEYERA